MNRRWTRNRRCAHQASFQEYHFSFDHNQVEVIKSFPSFRQIREGEGVTDGLDHFSAIDQQ